MQAAARRPQADGGVAGQPGAAVVQHPNVFGADAPVDQPHLVHGRHPVEHRLEHGAGLLGGHQVFLLVQPLVQGHAAGVFQHGVDGVVGLHHVQHRLQAGGRGDALDAAVQVPKVHPGGLEQHLAAGLGAQLIVRPPLGRKGDGQVLLDGHPEAAPVFHPAVEDALPVDAQHLAHRVAAGQQGAHRQGPGGVAAGKAALAVGAAFGPLFQHGPAVRAKDRALVHLLSPFRSAGAGRGAPPFYRKSRACARLDRTSVPSGRTRVRKGAPGDTSPARRRKRLHIFAEIIPAGPLRFRGCARRSARRRHPPARPAACPSA